MGRCVTVHKTMPRMAAKASARAAVQNGAGGVDGGEGCEGGEGEGDRRVHVEVEWRAWCEMWS